MVSRVGRQLVDLEYEACTGLSGHRPLLVDVAVEGTENAHADDCTEG